MSLEKVLKQISDIETPVYRFAPSPNGMPTLGHVKGLCLIDHVCKLTKGTFLLRFDDTNPKETYHPSYYTSMIKIAERLKIQISEIHKSSENSFLYNQEIKRLISDKKAFFCSCVCKTDVKENSECNCITKDQSLEKLEIKSGLCVKFKSKKESPYVIYRPISGEWYPTIALQGPIDDHAQKVSVVFRGRDLESLEKRQKEIHEALYSTPYPLTMYWGRVSIWDPLTKKVWAISKSQLSSTAFPALSFFERWGIPLEVLKTFLLDYGFTKNDIKLDLLKLSYFQIGYMKQNSLTSPYIKKKIKNGPEFFGYKRKNYILNYKTWKFKKLLEA